MMQETYLEKVMGAAFRGYPSPCCTIPLPVVRPTHSVNMSQTRTRKRSAFDEIPDLSNVANKLIRVCTNATLALDAVRRVSVQVFGSDGDADHKGAEV